MKSVSLEMKAQEVLCIGLNISHQLVYRQVMGRVRTAFVQVVKSMSKPGRETSLGWGRVSINRIRKEMWFCWISKDKEWWTELGLLSSLGVSKSCIKEDISSHSSSQEPCPSHMQLEAVSELSVPHELLCWVGWGNTLQIHYREKYWALYTSQEQPWI